MDFNRIISELRGELTRMNEAIMALERIAYSRKRRGRPPAWLTAVTKASEEPDVEPKRRGRPRQKRS
jgi:hypothetical protein